MREETRGILDGLRRRLESTLRPGLESYREKYGSESMARFWKLLREDLMRQTPVTLPGYLGNDNLRLAEASSSSVESDFRRELLADFNRQDESRRAAWIEAMIFFCLEMDAAGKLAELKISDAEDAEKEKKRLGKLLDIWEAV